MSTQIVVFNSRKPVKEYNSNVEGGPDGKKKGISRIRMVIKCVNGNEYNHNTLHTYMKLPKIKKEIV